MQNLNIMRKVIKAIRKIRVLIFGLFFFILSCGKNKDQKVLLKNNIESKNTILFTYNSDGIQWILTTYENGKNYTSKNYMIKKKDGYYEDVDLITNDSIRDYKKVLVLYNDNYTYDIPVPMPSFDGKVKVSIKQINPNKYLYTSNSGGTGIRFFFDGNYKIYKVIRVLSPKDSLIYE
ncbi:hypothetical protein QE441_000356 [Chryseobacterium sp. SORGH_AS909]|uniref:Lipoprotein n=2 Tax=Chryseobacterium group TaxID=2782232 RepID=A0ABU0TJH4_9FLAO|nr:hypothetical protein [Chryseobacterium camelliae]MDQ1101119.1 hypothetical protein [Chryseobacterium sp. SORGH_AS_1048]MDR6084562.1 hypothetical protein [Chryseobacterium sp. SORGH_AS_0909]MDR6132831.1 hypothetical protein [Chryseobacterium sp. SORGH_AS_1175]MDT3408961.1 hypothetical protein [Pseudacidovorax intermedius]